MESMQFGDYVINLRRELHMHPELSMDIPKDLPGAYPLRYSLRNCGRKKCDRHFTWLKKRKHRGDCPAG